MGSLRGDRIGYTRLSVSSPPPASTRIEVNVLREKVPTGVEPLRTSMSWPFADETSRTIASEALLLTTRSWLANTVAVTAASAATAVAE